MKYSNNNQEKFYDMHMLNEILQVNISFLKRQMKLYQFPISSYIKYQNKHLFTEPAVIDFIIYLAKQRAEKDIIKLKKIKPPNGI
jgi:hypothetical protein